MKLRILIKFKGIETGMDADKQRFNESKEFEVFYQRSSAFITVPKTFVKAFKNCYLFSSMSIIVNCLSDVSWLCGLVFLGGPVQGKS